MSPEKKRVQVNFGEDHRTEASKRGRKRWGKRNQVSEQQLGFSVWSAEFAPRRVLDVEDGRHIVRVVEQRALWRDRPGGDCLFADQRAGNDVIEVNPSDWQMLGKKEDLEEKGGGKYSGLVVVAPPIKRGFVGTLSEGIRVAAKKLRPESPVVVCERKGEEPIDKEARAAAFEDAGIVQRRVLIRKSDKFVVIEGRTAKKGKRKPVDLTDRSRPGIRKLTEIQWLEMVRGYAKMGFRVINASRSPIVQELKASRNALETRGRLKMWWGVELEGTCGCHLTIDLKGHENFIRRCGMDHEHLVKR